MPIERRRTGDGRMVIHLTDDAGEVEAILTLTRPTYHCMYAAYLLNAQRDIMAREGGPREWVEPIQFPVERRS